jgi:hypothetical protein
LYCYTYKYFNKCQPLLLISTFSYFLFEKFVLSSHVLPLHLLSPQIRKGHFSFLRFCKIKFNNFFCQFHIRLKLIQIFHSFRVSLFYQTFWSLYNVVSAFSKRYMYCVCLLLILEPINAKIMSFRIITICDHCTVLAQGISFSNYLILFFISVIFFGNGRSFLFSDAYHFLIGNR